ncbi:hypothetical protein [Acinetobacter sp. HR7]|uniref:hypothetical protein n=1 Tax=Acinetobacter sp. HR7 TaxID=1509403 RepID=UPI000A4CE425|nr:hypothetical protein [Acinetobacter sp. HR7]
MSMDLVKKLNVTVTPYILKDELNDLLEKDQALCRFYPFLLSILHVHPSLIADLIQQLDPSINAIFQGNYQLQQQYLQKLQQQLNRPIPETEFEQVLNRAIIPCLGFLEHEAGTIQVEGIVHLLDHHAEEIHQALPTWATPILEALAAKPVPRWTRLQTMSVRKQYQQNKVQGIGLGIVVAFIVILFSGIWGFAQQVYTDHRQLERQISRHDHSQHQSD